MLTGITSSQNTEGNKIESVEWINCGYCQNDVRRVYRNNILEGKRVFQAGVILIKHKDIGYILYDTGYSEEIYKCGITSKVYNLLNPTTVNKDVIIDKKLEKRGISTKDISKVIISHGHPDHIGGLKAIGCKSIFTTDKVAKTMKKHSLRDLVFDNLIPDGLEYEIINTLVEHVDKNSWLYKYFDVVYDIFGDGSILGIELDGHADGMLGLYIPEIETLLASDASWGCRYVEDYDYMKRAGRLLQNNWEKYVDTSKRILKLYDEKESVRVYFSHDSGKEFKLC